MRVHVRVFACACVYLCVCALVCVRALTCVLGMLQQTRVGTRSHPPPDLFDHNSAEADGQSRAPQAKSFPFQAYSPHQAFVVCSPGVGTKALSDAVECTRSVMRRVCWTLA